MEVGFARFFCCQYENEISAQTYHQPNITQARGIIGNSHSPKRKSFPTILLKFP